MTIKWVSVRPPGHERRAVLLRHAADGAQHPGDARQRPDARRRCWRRTRSCKVVGIAEAFAFAGQTRERYADFFEADGTLLGPGFTAEEAARLPENLRDAAGIVVSRGEPAPVGAYR